MTASAGDTFDSLATQKLQLRRQLRAQRSALTPRQRLLAARRCTRKTLPRLRGARRVGVYLHRGAELDTHELIGALLQSGRQVYVPVTSHQHSMQWVALTRLTRLVRGQYGIRVPRPKTPRALLNRLQWLVVPLVGVDRELNRLGAGGGYYDRLPQRPHRLPRWLGWAYAQQCVDSVPQAPWDRPLDALITDWRPAWPTG
jgi:5-formyltetrahydrofolate cyclo-ligase